MSDTSYGLMAIAVGISIYYLLTRWFQGVQYTKDTRIDGKVVLITGANSGIGKETAMNLARRGATVYIACRDFNRAALAKFDIIGKTGNKNVYIKILDLSSFDSIRIFVRHFKRLENRLDILINNAGIIGPYSRETTKDGLEATIGTNHFGHFLLTNLLLDMMKASAPARIINVSSVSHKSGNIDKGDLQLEQSYTQLKSYEQSKLANVLFTRELSRRLEGTGVTVNSLHPGVAITEMMKSYSYWHSFLNALNLSVQSAEGSAQTTVMCAVDPDLQNVTGKYFSDCALASESEGAKDDEMALWLWEESERLTHLNDTFELSETELADVPATNVNSCRPS